MGGLCLVHKKSIKGNDVCVFVSSISMKRMEIAISISPNLETCQEWQKGDCDFSATTGTAGLAGLLEVKKALPSIVSWIQSIGFVPIADPADGKRVSAFLPTMKKLGIETY